MKKILVIFSTCFFYMQCLAQADEHVLLTLSLDSVFSITDKEPGGSVYIQQGNQIMYSKSFGLSNLKTKTEFTENTISNIGAVANTCIAYSILILQKQNLLSINDSIVKFFPNIKSKKTVGQVKISHLLSHTSGLPNIIVKNNGNFSFIELLDKTEFEPGSNYKYSEMDYAVLAFIIEKVTNSKWQFFVQKNIFEPLGMTKTQLVDGINSEDKTIAYKKENKKYSAKKDISCYEASVLCSSVWSNINDLRKYVYGIKECVFLDCLLSKISTQVFQPANWRSVRPAKYGFSWEVSGEKKDILKCEENPEGFKANIILYEKAGIIVIWLSNNNISYTEIIQKKLLALGYIKP